MNYKIEKNTYGIEEESASYNYKNNMDTETPYTPQYNKKHERGRLFNYKSNMHSCI